MSRAEFARIAPRLERAHRERRLELAAALQARRDARETVMRLEALVAHRELQVIRAWSRRGSRRQRQRYMTHRENKLQTARTLLERAQARARRLGA